MKRELGIGRCGLACCLCSENAHCKGCGSGDCPDKDWCENRACSISKGIAHCFECDEGCTKGMLSKIKPKGFSLFASRYGEEELLDCLERNEKAGVRYHRDGIFGDYDEFDDPGQLIRFIRTGKREETKNIGYCGLDCGNCDARIATITHDEELRKKTAELWSKLNQAEITPDMIDCTGCRVEGAKTPYCESYCQIRQCAMRKGISTCGECEEMKECETLSAITANNEEALKNLLR